MIAGDRRRARREHSPRRFSPLARTTRVQARCFEITDSSTTPIDAAFLLQGSAPRDPNPQIARLARQFVELNRGVLSQIGTTVAQQFDGRAVSLQLSAGTHIGAVPLTSPTTGQPDIGLTVRPRFEWSGLGPMLGEMGWRIVPASLALPLLPHSRSTPRWVLSSIVLARMEALLKHVERRFEVVHEVRTAPRGSVDWTAYAQDVARAQFLRVPCSFPDLRDDRDLRSAIRFTLESHLQSLDGQRSAGTFVLQLIQLFQDLARHVSDAPPRRPSPLQLDAWLRRSLSSGFMRPGIQAIEWTAEERGLGGLSDLQGLPWSMSMESFFEAWAEGVLSAVARRIGGIVRAGRLRQTITPLRWDPPYVGSQKFLLPDLVVERGDTTVIVDAKYKEHFEELQDRAWSSVDEVLRERHRADLLQVLAYANVATTLNVTVCLAYPCKQATWQSLKDRGRLFHRASLTAGERRIELVLTALPMGARMHDVAEPIASFLLRED